MRLASFRLQNVRKFALYVLVVAMEIWVVARATGVAVAKFCTENNNNNNNNSNNDTNNNANKLTIHNSLTTAKYNRQRARSEAKFHTHAYYFLQLGAAILSLST